MKTKTRKAKTEDGTKTRTVYKGNAVLSGKRSAAITISEWIGSEANGKFATVQVWKLYGDRKTSTIYFAADEIPELMEMLDDANDWIADNEEDEDE